MHKYVLIFVNSGETLKMYVVSKHLKPTIQGQEHLIRTRGTDRKEITIPVGTDVYGHVNKQIRIPGSPLRSTCSQCSITV